MKYATVLAMAGAATLGLSSVANATVSVVIDDLNGNLKNHITEDTGSTQGATTVFGTDGITAQDVAFSSNDGTLLDITPGSGFASVTPVAGATLFSLIIDPLYDFTQYEFAVATDTDTMITVYYQLAGSSTWYVTSATPGVNFTPADGTGDELNPFQQKANANVNYDVISNSTLSALYITSSSAVNAFKQNAIVWAPGVPEPGSWAMMLLGFGGIGMAMRRRRRDTALAQLA